MRIVIPVLEGYSKDGPVFGEKEIKEGHPIWEAIDSGGGQVCDIEGVLRELNKAGYTIIPRMPLGSPRKAVGAFK